MSRPKLNAGFLLTDPGFAGKKCTAKITAESKANRFMECRKHRANEKSLIVK